VLKTGLRQTESEALAEMRLKHYARSCGEKLVGSAEIDQALRLQIKRYV
jgi:hypothetical protein